MKKYTGALLFALTPLANAIEVSQTFNITPSGQGSVGFLNFSLNAPQSVDIFTQGPTIDPEIYLFSGLSPSTNTLLTGDDDGCPDAFCGVAGSANNSLIENFSLTSGDYTVAVSDFPFESSEAIAGTNDNARTGDVVVTVRDAGTITGLFVPNDTMQIMEDMAQVEQEQTQSENTVRVTSNVIGNHFVDVIAIAFGLDASPSGPDIGKPKENQLGASSDSASAYSPDAFWGKHVYTNLTEDGGNLGYDTDLYQFIGGLDKRIGNFFIGSAVSYVYGETNQAGNNNSTHTIGITPYAAYKINDFLFASGLASYNYTSVNGTEGRRDADVHNYSGELTLNAFKAIDSFIVKGRGGLRYTHNFTSLEGTIDGSYDQLTWIGDVEFGYHINNKVNVFTGVLYEYIDKEATVGTNVLAVNSVTHDGVVYARAGVNYRVNDELSFGLDASSDLNDEDNDIMSFGASVRLEL